jgi:phage gpG-like protein
MAKQPLGFSKGKKTIVKMTGCEITIQESGTAETIAYMQSLQLRAKEMQVPLARFGAYMVDTSIPLQFKAQGTPQRWKPLSKKYAAWKRAHYGNLPKLVITGAMRDAFTWQTTPRTLRIENNVSYWTYHQTGTRKMPARPPLNVRVQDREKLNELAQLWLMQETGGGVL